MKAIIVNGKTLNPYENGLSDLKELEEIRHNFEVTLYLLSYVQWRMQRVEEIISLLDGAKGSFRRGDNLDAFYAMRATLTQDTQFAYTQAVFDVLRLFTIAAINKSWRAWFVD